MAGRDRKGAGVAAIARHRLPLLVLAVLSLLGGLGAGLLRAGWPLPTGPVRVPGEHGILMLFGFLVTLIGLERAVAAGKRWAYAAPVLSGVSGLWTLLGWPQAVGQGFAAAAGVALLGVFVDLYRRHLSGALATMGLGAIFLVVGALIWSRGAPISSAAPWWIGFLVLVIAGERWELSRLMTQSWGSRLGFSLAVLVVTGGLVATIPAPAVGLRLSGVGLLGLAVWLLWRDMAWRTLRQAGLPRYMAICLISGYLWLGFGGGLWILAADHFSAGVVYDAMLHSILLGFVFSMIFAHAPIILPSVLAVGLVFSTGFYAHWALLHLSTILRVAGDLGAWVVAREWGALGNALALLLFLANSGRAALRGFGEAGRSR